MFSITTALARRKEGKKDEGETKRMDKKRGKITNSKKKKKKKGNEGREYKEKYKGK
jgi:hypothetical protein